MHHIFISVFLGLVVGVGFYFIGSILESFFTDRRAEKAVSQVLAEYGSPEGVKKLIAEYEARHPEVVERRKEIVERFIQEQEQEKLQKQIENKLKNLLSRLEESDG